jgi:hypothetical protein
MTPARGTPGFSPGFSLARPSPLNFYAPASPSRFLTAGSTPTGAGTSGQAYGGAMPAPLKYGSQVR